MKFDASKKRNQRTVRYITIAGFLLGLLYPLCAGSMDSPIALINGISIGILGGVLVALFELYLLGPMKLRSSFISTVLVKSTSYFFLFIFLILVLMNFNEAWYYGVGMYENFKSARFQTFLYDGDFKVIVLYSLLSVSAIIFTREISRKMGQGVFLNFLTGKYHFPCEEERIFMFLDQKSSTQLAEEMGSLGYYTFLKEFYSDVTQCILGVSGEIYRYVGDQVVISWSVKKGLKNANCIRCYFYIKNEIERQKEKYLVKYSHIPEFGASIHLGKVIRGEVGDVKSQIVFHGEALYETAHMEKECRKQGFDILVSNQLLELVSLPVIYQTKHVARIPVLNNGKNINLYTIEESGPNPV
ncbi:adenylate/guanylate cyclase domain-containing protein [Spongiimicrobium sp. 2-473A-2-J]|uniref:adenylate/guanylate cyclase domain-containing protein n=1 Tax=Eudoraea algarum TaxID=3417568 RepID=UPI003D36E144